MFFLTHHGTFLGVDGAGRVVQRPLHTVTGPADLLDLDVTMPTPGERYRRSMETRADIRAIVVASGPFAGYVLHLLAEQRTAAISNNGQFLCAVPDSTTIVTDRTEIHGWETFLCMSRQDVLDVLHLASHDWIIGSTSLVVKRQDISLGREYGLRIGPLALDLRYNLPFVAAARSAPPASHDATADLLSAIVFVDGWRVEKIVLYRPMIFLTAFTSAAYIMQASMCIASIIEFGKYRGDFHVLTDYPRETFLEAIPSLDPDRLTVQSIGPRDWVGYVAAKYCVLEEPAAYTHQPLLFLDPDIVADADLNPMLSAIAMSPRIMAPMEDWHLLAKVESVGAALIRRAGCAPGLTFGFNGGTIGIPNLSSHGYVLEAIRTVIANYLEIGGRDGFQWADQEVANYVAFAVGGFDTATLLRYVRYGWEGEEFLTSRRIGLVHFWPPRGEITKQDAMRTYIDALRAADRTS